MSAAATLDPSQRQILVNLGSKYVVFGPSAGLSQPVHFDAEKDSEVLPRVADEGEATEERIAQTLRVAGMRRSIAIEGAPQSDVELLDDDGHHILIEIKVRERDPKQRDIEQAQQRLTEAARTGQTLEVWHFNVERLKLVVMRLDRSELRFDELIPLGVWEKTSEGVFDRSRVVEEVEDWVHRVEALYEDICAWLGDRPGLRCEQSRSVIMSEEMMQQFAVTDREIPVLDVLELDQVIASFVPRGLWMIASWGRIDIITRDRTRVLLAMGGMERLEWRLVAPDDRQRTVSFDKEAMLALVSPP